MKIFFSIFLSILSFTVDAQKNDTVFLVRNQNKKDGYYHKIYIDYNRNSKYYHWINNFGFDYNNEFHFDRDGYKEALQLLKGEDKRPLKENNIKGIPKQWCLLNQYKNKYYVYVPSDGGANYRINFTDTTMIEYGVESPEPSAILSFENIKLDVYQIKRKEYHGKVSTFTIHVIDRDKGIVIFENLFNYKPNRYILMVDASRIKEYPIIVNYCAESRMYELEFQKIDFKKLNTKK